MNRIKLMQLVKEVIANQKTQKLNEGNEGISSPEIIETPSFDNATWKKTGKTKSFFVLNADGYRIDSYVADGVEVDNKALRIREDNEITIKEGFVFIESIGSQGMTMTSRSAYVTRPGNLYRATTDGTDSTRAPYNENPKTVEFEEYTQQKTNQ